MEEIIKAVNAHFGAGIISDIYFVQRDTNGVIRTVSPCIQSDNVKELVNKLLSSSEALKIMASDLINKQLNKN
jgi:hypothetical protein